MKLYARLDGDTVVAKAWGSALRDTTGWTDISEWPFVNEGENLSARIIDVARTVAVSRVELGYALAMQSGFTSSALGSPYWYASDGMSMALLVGAAASGADRRFECTDANRLKQFAIHTAAQMNRVLNDGAIVAEAHKDKKRLLLANIAAATSVDQINAITW